MDVCAGCLDRSKYTQNGVARCWGLYDMVQAPSFGSLFGRSVPGPRPEGCPGLPGAPPEPSDFERITGLPLGGWMGLETLDQLDEFARQHPYPRRPARGPHPLLEFYDEAFEVPDERLAELRPRSGTGTSTVTP